MTHTPGPWKVTRFAQHIVDSTGTGIAFEVTHEDDARLIAAAPQLLEACKEVEWVPLAVEDTYYCPWCGAFNIDGDTHGEHKPTCTRQAAIRAAEGEDDD